MKVYVVFGLECGSEYSDYHMVAICSTMEKAQEQAKMYEDDCMQDEFDADSIHEVDGDLYYESWSGDDKLTYIEEQEVL